MREQWLRVRMCVVVVVLEVGLRRRGWRVLGLVVLIEWGCGGGCRRGWCCSATTRFCVVGVGLSGTAGCVAACKIKQNMTLLVLLRHGRRNIGGRLVHIYPRIVLCPHQKFYNTIKRFTVKKKITFRYIYVSVQNAPQKFEIII